MVRFNPAAPPATAAAACAAAAWAAWAALTAAAPTEFAPGGNAAVAPAPLGEAPPPVVPNMPLAPLEPGAPFGVPAPPPMGTGRPAAMPGFGRDGLSAAMIVS